MSYKKQIITILTLIVLLLLTMSTTIQAASVGRVYNLNAKMEGSQIELTWSSVSGAAGYNVYVNNTRIGSVNSNEASLIGFLNNTTYTFKIAAYDYQKVEGTASAEVRFTTDSGTTSNLGKVTNLTATQVNGFVTLNWSAVSGANRYQVFVDIPNFGDVNIGEVTTTNAMLQGFKDGQKYGFSIRACQNLSSGKVKYGDKSNSQYLTINYNQDNSDYNTNNNIKVGTVNNVSVYNITTNQATVTWNYANNADGYEIKLSRNYGTYQVVATKTNNYAYLSGLEADSYYRVKVVAYKWVNGKKVYGEESSYKDFYTNKKVDTSVGQIANLSISNVTKNSAYVSWSKASNATGYNIYVSKNYGTYQYLTSTTSTNYTMKNLDNNTFYQIKVEPYRKVNGSEYTAISSFGSFTTLRVNLDEKIPTVSHLRAEVRNRNEAYLTWWPVDSDIDGYEVYLAKGNSRFELIEVKYLWENSTIITSDRLDYATDYKVKVRAYKGYYDNDGIYRTKYSDYSNVEYFRTEQYNKTQDSPNVPKVTGVTATVKGTVANLKWNNVYGAAGYEIDFTVPGIGHVKLDANTNSREIAGIAGKNYDYTARIRAYKYINGTKEYGTYSDVIKLREN